MLRKTLKLSYTALIIAAFAAAAFAQTEIVPDLPAPGSAPPNTPVALYGQLKAGTSNNKGALCRNNGASPCNPVTLRGMSLFWSNAGNGGGYYNDATVGWLAYDWNVSVVRAAIAAYNEKGGGGVSGGYIEDPTGTLLKARKVINAAIRRGIYVLVDWHTHNATGTTSAGGIYPGSNTPNVNVKDKAKEFFEIIAAEYKGYPNVLFEIYNEPCPVEGQKACRGESWNDIKTYANDVVKAIRAKGNNNLVIVGSPMFSQQPNAALGVGNAVTDAANNIAYSIHFYTRTHYESIRNNMTDAVDGGLPVFATEWGTSNADGGNDGACDTSSNTPNWITSMENNRVGWANWSVTASDQSTAALAVQKTDGGPWSLTKCGDWVRRQIRGKNSYSGLSKSSYTITVTQPTAGGTIVKTPAGSGAMNFGTEFTLTARPNEGWEFLQWTGDAVGTDTVLKSKVSGIDATVSAEFYNGGFIRNGHFTANANNWSRVSLAPAQSSAMAVENGQMTMNVTTAGSVDNVRIRQANSLSGGRKYRLTFEARTGSGQRTLTVGASGTATSATQQVSLTQNMPSSPFSMEFNVPTTESVTIGFSFGNQTGAVYFDNVKLVDAGIAGITAPISLIPQKTAWSLYRSGGALSLVGPSDAGAKVTLYDVRGKAVRSARAVDGMAIGGKGLSAGNYLVVVRNASGKEVLRDRVSLLK